MTTAAATLDPRTTLARPDLAEQALEGIVRAAAFRAVRAMHCAVPVADIHADAAPGDHPVDQLIFGEAFDILDTREDQVWGRARRDGVVGWVRLSALRPGAPLATHRIGATDATLPLNALVVEVGDPAGLAPIGSFAAEPVEVAERLVGTPYKLGGRSSLGTDCCGLVQQALYACGRAAPRYADQLAELGQAVAVDQARRGDLVIWLDPEEGPWNGHAGFILDEDRVLHAVGRLGGVVIEPFAEADARHRVASSDGPVIRRL
ncbi:MAG: C40 family peptidase [Alphaproteobacteria bacterium]|nr:C40 family peptidase [Alphaproteobacteria bacterium]MBU2041220.1 C40 family peptidase [Alphaproteobacteria bacterium]MBU2125847.1 C40 family peptidase [Alphaproteobacteria bacterium]MBU2208100.1 C40 family peptidase [Alphaproteobacteria bacterium]MBU2291367.1 C40 family peptidase [Alphaproteobacteria bacterium]